MNDFFKTKPEVSADEKANQVPIGSAPTQVISEDNYTRNIREKSSDNSTPQNELQNTEQSQRELRQVGEEIKDTGDQNQSDRESDTVSKAYANSIEQSKQELINVFQKNIYEVEDARTIVIFGKRGTGKTFDTDFLSRCFISAGWRVHSILTVSSKISGCPHINDVRGAYYHSLYDVGKLNLKSCVVIDEVDTFAPSAGKVDEHINKIVNFGRHLKIWAVWNARRPAKVSTDLTGLADICICHYLSSEKDIRYVEEITDEDFAERIRRLKFKIEREEISRFSREIFIG